MTKITIEMDHSLDLKEFTEFAEEIDKTITKSKLKWAVSEVRIE